jgi:hypothetical protein
MMNTNMIAEDHWKKDSTADWITLPVEIGNGALVEVTVWVDDEGQADWNKPKAVMYKGTQINDVLVDSQWLAIEDEIDELLLSGWY